MNDETPIHDVVRSSVWTKWQVYCALLGIFMTFISVVYNVGVGRTADEARVTQLEKEVATIQAEYERRDVVEQRLLSIEAAERRIEESARIENETLQKLLMETRRVR